MWPATLRPCCWKDWLSMASLETENGMTLPFSSGASFYTTNHDTGLIQTGFRAIETPFKPDDVMCNALIFPAKIMEALWPKDTSPMPASPDQEFASIIERADNGLNRRDIDVAIECFTDDKVWKTRFTSMRFQEKRNCENTTLEWPTSFRAYVRSCWMKLRRVHPMATLGFDGICKSKIATYWKDGHGGARCTPLTMKVVS
jgi:hypothetical protein